MTVPDDLERLLRHERSRTELPPEELDAAWNALQATLHAHEAARPEPATGARSEPIRGASHATWMARTLLTGATALAFASGVLVGRLTEPSPAPPSPAPSFLPSPVASSTRSSAPPPAIRASDSEMPAATGSPLRPPAPPPSTSRVRAAPSAAPSAPAASSTLADERALVEGARTALLRGRAADALDLAQKHESSYPDGALAEDRDFLIVSALRDLGRTGESRARAALFLERYPKSGLRGAVETMAR